jgi:hypothetical protein
MNANELAIGASLNQWFLESGQHMYTAVRVYRHHEGRWFLHVYDHLNDRFIMAVAQDEDSIESLKTIITDAIAAADAADAADAQ